MIISITPANTANPTVQPLTSRVAISPPFLAYGWATRAMVAPGADDNLHPVGVISSVCRLEIKGMCESRSHASWSSSALSLPVLSLVAAYVRFQALDTNTVKNTADDLIADKAIRDQVAATLVDQLYANVDVQAELQKKLPQQIQGARGAGRRGLAGVLRPGGEGDARKAARPGAVGQHRHTGAQAADRRARGRRRRGDDRERRRGPRPPGRS